MKKILITIIFLASAICSKAQWQAGMFTYLPVYNPVVVMDTTGIASLPNSAVNGLGLLMVSNVSASTAPYNNYQIMLQVPMANTAPSSPSTFLIYICPFFSDDGGTTWYGNDQGTLRAPLTTVGKDTIASPNNLILAKALAYTTQNQTIQATFLLSDVFGLGCMPMGWKLILINNTGAAVGTGTVKIKYVPIR